MSVRSHRISIDAMKSNKANAGRPNASHISARCFRSTMSVYRSAFADSLRGAIGSEGRLTFHLSLRYHIWYIQPMAWTVGTNETVDAEPAALPVDMRARLVRVAELIESMGLPNVREPHVKQIRGPLWKMRRSWSDGQGQGVAPTLEQRSRL